VLGRAAIVAALALAAACAHAPGGSPDVDTDVDGATEADVLDGLEQAFLALRDGAHDDAHDWLELTVPAVDDLSLPGTTLEKAFASDVTKPYKGRPHERVLATTILAALDMERGRCDLALPTLRNAAFLDARSRPDEPSDAVLVHVLALRCLQDTHASPSDVERARGDLKSALDVTGAAARLDELERLALAPDLTLALDGVGPTVVVEGESREKARVVPSGDAAPAGVVDASPARDAVRIRLGGSLSSAARGPVVWSSSVQATTVRGRPFDEVLAARAAEKRAAWSTGTSLVHDGVTSAVSSSTKSPRQAIGGAVAATAGLGLAGLAALTDARADGRYVADLFERGVLLGTPSLAPSADLGSPPPHACSDTPAARSGAPRPRDPVVCHDVDDGRRPARVAARGAGEAARSVPGVRHAGGAR
jgi:hypothetical protein